MTEVAAPLATSMDREASRIATRLTVRFGMGRTERTGYAENVSEGGIYINTNEPYRVSDRVLLRIEFPERTLVRRGEIVWAIRVPDHQRESMICGMGISFIDHHADWPEFFQRWKSANDAQR